jgi:hypothetical protein
MNEYEIKCYENFGFFANLTIRPVKEIFYVLVFRNTYIEDEMLSLLKTLQSGTISSISVVESIYGPGGGGWGGGYIT